MNNQIPKDSGETCSNQPNEEEKLKESINFVDLTETSPKNEESGFIKKEYFCPIKENFHGFPSTTKSENVNPEPQNSQVHKCDFCGKTCSSKSNLKKHKDLHKDEKNFLCEKCGMCFKRKSYLNDHIKNKHEDERPRACDECEQSFRRGQDLKRHSTVHTGCKKYSCTLCPKSFSEQSKLKQHIRSHTKEKTHTCDVCQKQFTCSANYKKHMERKHPKK